MVQCTLCSVVNACVLKYVNDTNSWPIARMHNGMAHQTLSVIYVRVNCSLVSVFLILFVRLYIIIKILDGRRGRG